MSLTINLKGEVLATLPEQYVNKLISVGNNIKERYRETVEIQTRHPLILGLCSVLSQRFHD